MPTNKIRRSDVDPTSSGSAIGVNYGLNSKAKRITYKDSADVKRFIAGNTVVSKTASFTIVAEDDGKLFTADSATSVVATLPAASESTKGMRVGLAVGTVTAGTGHAFSPAAADKILGNGFTSADDKDAICSGASDREGDILWLECDGSLGWFITGVIGTWAREA